MSEENNLKNELESLRRELEKERQERASQDKILRIEEKLNALDRRIDDGLNQAKQGANRAYTTIGLFFAILGFIGWTTINSMINKEVKSEIEKQNVEEQVQILLSSTEKKIEALNSEINLLSDEAKNTYKNFQVNTLEQTNLVKNYTKRLIKNNPKVNFTNSQEAKKAGLKITPIFGIIPGFTTRKEIEEMLSNKKLTSLGKFIRKDNPFKYEFEFGEIYFTETGSRNTANDFDNINRFKYWGNESIGLGLNSKLSLEKAKAIAEKNFVWLGTQSFRGLVFSNKKEGPILLEISLNFEKPNNLDFEIYGPL